MIPTLGTDISASFDPPVNPTSIQVTDGNPPGGKAFYLFGAEFIPPGP